MHAASGTLSWRRILGLDARETGDALGDHAQIATGADERFFQLTHKVHCANAGLKGAQIKDRIANELPRAMEGHVTSAVRLMQFNAIGGEKFTRSDNVLRARVAPQGNDRRMFQQQKSVGDALVLYQLNKRLLQFERNGILHAAEIQNIDDAELHSSILCQKWR